MSESESVGGEMSAAKRRVLGLVIVCITGLVLSACAPQTETSDSAARSQPSPSLAIESPSSGSPEAPGNSLSETPAIEAETKRSLAVVTAACLNGLLSSEQMYIPARDWHGIVIGHAVTRGDFEIDEVDPFLIQEMQRSDFTTQAFETAATLDLKWQPLTDLWNQGSKAVKKAWNGGASSLEALDGAWEYAEKLEARCRVPFSDASRLASDDDVSLAQWILSNSDGLLSLDLINE